MIALDKAVELFRAGRLEEARRSCRKAVRERPDLPETHLLLAEIQRGLGEEERAQESDARVLRLQPGWTRAHLASALGDLYADFGRMPEAEARYRSALGLDPDHAEARERLVRLLYQERRFEELERLCRDTMARFPRESLYPEKLGAALWFLGRHEEAVQAYGMAMDRAASPEAMQDAGLNKALSLLALGRYAEGWDSFRWRHPRARLRAAHPQIVDDPAALASLAKPAHIRIHAEQGLGDELFFLRFADALRRSGHWLSATGDPRLAALLPAFFDAGAGAADFSLCSGDLPSASGQVFAPPLALSVDGARSEHFRGLLEKFGPPPYIGVTWRAGVLPDEPKPQRGAFLMKEVPPERLAQAIAPSDVRVVILQRRPDAEDLRRFAAGLGRAALDLSRVNVDLRDALAALALLDDYVGVSNTNMHLRAGLPGRPARVLVSMPPEWRWGLHGSTSEWFPAFTVYRRRFGDDWTQVLSKLGQDLRERYAAPQHR